MFVQNFPSGPFDTNAYIVACTRTKQAALIDPAPGCFDQVVSFIKAKELVLTKILLTHSHWDHIADVARFKDAFKVPVYVHSADRGNLEAPGSDGVPCWLTIEGVKPDKVLEEKDRIELGDLAFEVIHTPGHTPGSICFYCPEKLLLLSGDTLFRGSIGNLSLPTSEPSRMWPSLDKLAALPPETEVYPGHGPKTSIGREHWLPRAREVFDT